MQEPDGTTRLVEYTADDHNGFNAVVKKIGHAHHPAVYGKHHDVGNWNGDAGNWNNGYAGAGAGHHGAHSYSYFHAHH